MTMRAFIIQTKQHAESPWSDQKLLVYVTCLTQAGLLHLNQLAAPRNGAKPNHIPTLVTRRLFVDKKIDKLIVTIH